MALEVHSVPKVYLADGMPGYLVAEGTDGCLYRVPSEPGGWMQRCEYQGRRDALKPVPPREARTRVWITYGDMGAVTIAEG